MKQYEIGNKIPNGEIMVRRLRQHWVMSDQTISREAFRPRKMRNGEFEDGVSIDIKRLLREPIGNDYWSNERKMATGQFRSDAINALLGYEIIYTGPSPSHCIIAGDMEALYFDSMSRRALAAATVCIHKPDVSP